MQHWHAWVNGRWTALSDAVLGVDDLGTLQAVTAVERLRTSNGKLLDLAQHLQRFQASCHALHIELPSNVDCGELLRECVLRNLKLSGEPDLSIVLVATPGRVHQSQGATLVAYAQALPWQRMRSLYEQGEALVVGEVRNIPRECWSPQIKTRARLQYYLADHFAAQSAPNRPSSGLLLDLDGFVTETSSANLIAVFGRELRSPLESNTLRGISLQRTIRLAPQCGLSFENVAMKVETLQEADAILLCGTNGCLWHANSILTPEFEQHYPLLDEVETCRSLCLAWTQDIGLDYRVQVKQQSASPKPYLP